LAGYAAKDVKVVVNGTPISYEQAFKDHSSMKERINRQANQIQSVIHAADVNVSKPSTPASPHAMKAIKTELQRAYAADQAARAAAAAPAAGPAAAGP
jgi:hypothetical protein